MNVSIVGGKTLKVKFTQDGAKVTAQVLEQDESMRGKCEVTTKGSGYEIRSVWHPQISGEALFVRRYERSKDHTEPKYEFKSVMKAKEYIENISKLILKINAKHKWNAKVVCVIPQEPYFTKGKIYNVRNGFTRTQRTCSWQITKR